MSGAAPHSGKTILVAYTTNAGSTEEVAQAVADGLRNGAAGELPHVEVCRLEEVRSLDGYDGVVIGAPMILGWSRAAVNFVRRNRAALESKKVAYFCTMMALTAVETPASVALFVDPDLPAAPKNRRWLSIKERYATPGNYLRPVLRAAPNLRPVSVAFFGGCLELFKLKWWQLLFVVAVIGAAPGDRRNFAAMRAWGACLRADMGI